jgi:hypothetical protein
MPRVQLYVDAEPSGLGGRDVFFDTVAADPPPSAADLPPPGAPQPLLRLPPGDVRLANGTLLRLVLNGFRAGPGSVGGAVWDERPGRDGPRRKGLRVIATLDVPPAAHGAQPLLHVSLSLPGSLPSWRQVRLVKDAFFGPEVDAVMVLPREADYVNAMPFCFQLWQLPWVWGVR